MKIRKTSPPKKNRIPQSKHPTSSGPTDVQIGSNEERLRRMATVIQDSNDAITIQDL